MASSSVQRSLGIARAVPAAAAGRPTSLPRAPFFSTYLAAVNEDEAVAAERGGSSGVSPRSESAIIVARRMPARSRVTSLVTQPGAASRLRHCLLPRPEAPMPSSARSYGSAAHAYADYRPRDSEHDAVYASIFRQTGQRSQRERAAPLVPHHDGETSMASTNEVALPALKETRTQREWTRTLNLAAARDLLQRDDLTKTHLTCIIRWARKQPPRSFPLELEQAILSRVLSLHDAAVLRQALAYFQDSLKTLRKGQVARKGFSEREARLRYGEIILGLALEQPDLAGKAADLAVRAPKELRRSHVWPALAALLQRLHTSDETATIIDLATSAFPGIPFIANAPSGSDGDAAQISALVHHAFASIDAPVEWLRDHRAGAETDPLADRRTRWAGLILLRSLIRLDGQQRQALAVFDEMQASGTDVDEDVASSLCAWLGASGMHMQARHVYRSLVGRGALSLQARRRVASMFSAAGETALAEEVLGPGVKIMDEASTSPTYLLTRLQALARAGKAEEAVAMAHSALPDLTLGSPDSHITRMDGGRIRRSALSILLAAHARTGNIEGALAQLRGILAQGDNPSVADFNAILSIFAQRKDEASAVQLLQQMRSIGLIPDLITYSTLISLYSSRKEVEKAREVWQELLDARIQPDARASSTLINAHIESGSWKGVADVYRGLPHSQKQDPAIVNVMLKGLVLLAAPTVEVERTFQEAYPNGDGADERAWASLIQSACEGNRFDIALNAYEAMSAIAAGPGASLKMTPHVFSILIAGYLRKGDARSAKAVLEEMEGRGIERNSVVHSIIVKALADGSWPDADLSEEQYADQAVAQQTSSPGSRGSHAENIYAPLITASSRRSNAQAAEKYFRRIVAQGVQPTLPMYTTLLDAYRRANDLAGLEKTWQSLFRLVTAPMATADGSVSVPESQRNLLCIPLSIYMDALSDSGKHLQIATVWQEVSGIGFTFDSHNWNHLVAALIKAGEIERAFQITEEVLIPRQEEVQERMVAADRTTGYLATESSGDLAAFEGEFETEAVQRPPNRRHQYRRGHGGNSSNGPVKSMLDRATAFMYDQGLGSAGASDNAVRFNLNLFESWRPTDVVWRPSFLTIAVLDRAYSRLENGKAILGLTGSEEEEAPGEDGVAATSVSVGDNQPEDVAKQSSSPLILLGRINSRYAKTVGLIMFHRRKRSRRE